MYASTSAVKLVDWFVTPGNRYARRRANLLTFMVPPWDRLDIHVFETRTAFVLFGRRTATALNITAHRWRLAARNCRRAGSDLRFALDLAFRDVLTQHVVVHGFARRATALRPFLLDSFFHAVSILRASRIRGNLALKLRPVHHVLRLRHRLTCFTLRVTQGAIALDLPAFKVAQILRTQTLFFALVFRIYRRGLIPAEVFRHAAPALNFSFQTSQTL